MIIRPSPVQKMPNAIFFSHGRMKDTIYIWYNNSIIWKTCNNGWCRNMGWPEERWREEQLDREQYQDDHRYLSKEEIKALVPGNFLCY